MLAAIRDSFRLIAYETGVPRLLAIAAVARLHVGGLGLAVLLLAEEVSSSMATAGVATGLLSLGRHSGTLIEEGPFVRSTERRCV